LTYIKGNDESTKKIIEEIQREQENMDIEEEQLTLLCNEIITEEDTQLIESDLDATQPATPLTNSILDETETQNIQLLDTATITQFDQSNMLTDSQINQIFEEESDFKKNNEIRSPRNNYKRVSPNQITTYFSAPKKNKSIYNKKFK